jgi:cell division protein FtsB
MRCTCEAEVKRQTEALREENEKLKKEIKQLQFDIELINTLMSIDFDKDDFGL